ncbi:MAG: hypothetical protein GWO04_46230, partial [Actinobacteria bacterium]|nr:hypothetical protein [Actinomycetota bacterium]
MSGPGPRHLLTTDGGIEDLVADELRERVPEAGAELDAWPVTGRLRVANVALDELLRLTTINHVAEIRAEARATTLDEIAEVAG